MNQSLPKRTDELLNISRKKLNTTVGLLTGHIALRAYSFNLGLARGKIVAYAAMRGKTAYTFCAAVLLSL